MTILEIIANDNKTIPYRKELNQITGGVIQSIILSQVMYWYYQSGSKKYYKFIEPCEHNLYKKGNSWTEELGIKKDQFRDNIKKLKEKNLIDHSW